MATNLEIDTFLTSLRDEGPDVHQFVQDFLKLLDDAHNPEFARARNRLRALMQRDSEIGKHQSVWHILAPWLEERTPQEKPDKPKGGVINTMGIAPP